MTDQLIRPMRAADIKGDVSQLVYPLFASAKLDGIRSLSNGGPMLSKTMKPIPNLFIQNTLSGLGKGYDGELTLKTFNEAQSGIMSRDGEPDFTYWIFDDWWRGNVEYQLRLTNLIMRESSGVFKKFPRVKVLPQKLIKNEKDLLKYEEKMLLEGHEGLMLRHPKGIYKQGTSTVNEGYLIKLKRFLDDEAQIIGFEEAMENTNESKVREDGVKRRSHEKGGMVPKGTLGAVLVRFLNGEFKGKECRVGSGFSKDQAQMIWNNRKRYLNKICTIQYAIIGSKDLPRWPVFKGIRDKRDVS